MNNKQHEHNNNRTLNKVSIRIMDPARIAHGMNFFWRRAHLLDGDFGPPEVQDSAKGGAVEAGCSGFCYVMYRFTRKCCPHPLYTPPTAPAFAEYPEVAHVNGADPKEYFLRDRGVWYVDDFGDRFGESPQFLTYVHPRGQSLAEDFENKYIKQTKK